MQLRRRLPILSLLACLALSAAGVARGETLVIAADLWCPINCAVDSPRPGIFVELARDIFAEAGIQVRYETRNWARVLQEVRRGDINAAIGAGYEDAPDFLFGATPVALSCNCFYTRRDSTWRYAGVTSLPAVRLGVINDYSYGEQLDAYVQAVKEAGNVWGVPVIDFNAVTGLNPMVEEQLIYFYDAGYDRLHPSTKGQIRMARTLMYQLFALPATF